MITLYLPGVVRGDLVRRVDFKPQADGTIRVTCRAESFGFEIYWAFSLEKAFRDVIEANQSWRIK